MILLTTLYRHAGAQLDQLCASRLAGEQACDGMTIHNAACQWTLRAINQRNRSH